MQTLVHCVVVLHYIFANGRRSALLPQASPARVLPSFASRRMRSIHARDIGDRWATMIEARNVLRLSSPVNTRMLPVLNSRSDTWEKPGIHLVETLRRDSPGDFAITSEQTMRPANDIYDSAAQVSSTELRAHVETLNTELVSSAPSSTPILASPAGTRAHLANPKVSLVPCVWLLCLCGGLAASGMRGFRDAWRWPLAPLRVAADSGHLAGRPGWLSSRPRGFCVARRAIGTSVVESSDDEWGEYTITYADVAQAFQRLVLPAAGCGVVAALCFCPCALALRGLLTELAQSVLKDDFTQYTQNAFSLSLFLFGLLLGETFTVLFQRQERLYLAFFREVSEAGALLEQLSLLAGNRQMVDGAVGYESLFDSLEGYLTEDLKDFGKPRALMDFRDRGVDALESLLYATSVGVPSHVYEFVRALRQARAERLAAAQRSYPVSHFILVGIFGIPPFAFLVLLGAGTAGFEPPGQAALPGHLLFALAPLFGLLVTAVTMAVLLSREFAAPGVSSIYRVQDVVKDGLEGLLVSLRQRRKFTRSTD